MTREVDTDIEAGHVTLVRMKCTLALEEHAELGEELGRDIIMARLQLDEPL